MKIAIVTLYGNFNYGNKLQNYALQEVLKKSGNDVITLVVDKENNTIKRIVKKYVMKEDEKYKLIPIKEKKREDKFIKFTKKYISTAVYYYDDGKLKKKDADSFDYVVVGSDQVWNPNFWEKGSDQKEVYNFLLQFVSSKKRISYAASFGINEISDYWKPYFSDELKKFKAISVRETSGKNIVDQLCNKDAAIVLDPTMLLKPEEWECIESKKAFLQKRKYIFVYFLGEVTEPIREYIKKMSQKLDVDIVDIQNNQNGRIYKSDPADFISYIHHAELVITDSFHACAFSIMFHTPFLVAKREQKNMADMSDRINTLLFNMKLQSRELDINKYNVLSCDFSKSDKVLEKQRKISNEFLKNAMVKNS